MAELNILISGAGIAGPALAFWLSRSNLNATITIIERAPAPRTAGQAIDIRGPAVKVIRMMGLEETIQSKHTQEQGIAFVSEDGTIQAQFDASGDAEKQSGTSEYEILRADLAKVFMDATDGFENVKYAFGESIAGMEQHDGGVEVTFSGETAKTVYDLVVGADGMSSKTRQLLFEEPDSERDSDYDFLGQYQAYFSIPSVPSDGPLWQNHQSPGGRTICMRPHRGGQTVGAYLVATTPTKARDPELESALHGDAATQRATLRKYFKDVGWESARVLDGMDQASDFYFQQIAQVKLPKWSKDHGVLLGDAAYCPTPISGQGTSVAIVGAYVLAGELSKIDGPEGIDAALQEYEGVLKPYVEMAQKLPAGAPQIVNPQTKLGLFLLNGVLGFLGWSQLYKYLLDGVGEVSEKDWKLPEYEWQKP